MADAPLGVDVAQLVAEHHQAVYRYAYRLTGSVQDAEDLTQEVFLVAQQKIGQLRNIDMAKSWLFAVLRNSFLKGRQRKRPATAADVGLDVDSVSDTPPPDETDHDGLQAALKGLPEAFRLAVVMFYFEERSYKEIAEALDVPIGTVMSRLARAKAHLRSMLLEREQKAAKRRPNLPAKRG
jgi:RNA polymerase sigma-70 factor, ECF subfamily